MHEGISTYEVKENRNTYKHLPRLGVGGDMDDSGGVVHKTAVRKRGAKLGPLIQEVCLCK